MKLTARISASAALLVLLLGTTGCAKLKARDQLVKGVQAFKGGQYERAINFFQNSIKEDPSYANAHIYLATAYSYQVVQDDTSPGNMEKAQRALGAFNEVLAKNPDDLGALRQEASIYRKVKQFDKAKELEQHIIRLDPQDAEANYTIGVIDWTQAYKNAVADLALNKPPLTDDGNGNPKKSKDTCAQMVAQNTPLVTEALQYLQQAVNINNSYDDAMSYLNLTYRRKADLECGNDDARKADIAQADQWMQKQMTARKANEAAKEKKLGGGITM